MAKETTMQGRMGRLRRLLSRLTGNREELPQLELSRVRLEQMLALIQEAADRQAFHTAAKQEATQDLHGGLTEAERLATVLQLSVKQHYGIRAEKLADFGLKPFRGLLRKRRPAPEPTSPVPPPSPALPVSPVLPATPEPDRS